MITRAIIYCIILLATLPGCSKEVKETTTEEFRVTVTLSEASRVALDNQYLTWCESDCLTIYRLESGDMYDNKIGELQIDPTTISEDKKSAEFAASSISFESGSKYIATTRSTTIGSSNYLAFELNTNTYDYAMDIAPGPDQDGDGDDTQLEKDLLLSSQIFEASYLAEIPTLYFSIEESIIELNICFTSGTEYQINNISISAENLCFSRYIRLNRDGSFGLKAGEEASQIDNSISRTLNSAAIGGEYYTVLIPARWNEQMDATGNFVVTVTTSDAKSSSTEFSAKILEPGTIYQKSLNMSDPI